MTFSRKLTSTEFFKPMQNIRMPRRRWKDSLYSTSAMVHYQTVVLKSEVGGRQQRDRAGRTTQHVAHVEVASGAAARASRDFAARFLKALRKLESQDQSLR